MQNRDPQDGPRTEEFHERGKQHGVKRRAVGRGPTVPGQPLSLAERSGQGQVIVGVLELNPIPPALPRS